MCCGCHKNAFDKEVIAYILLLRVSSVTTCGVHHTLTALVRLSEEAQATRVPVLPGHAVVAADRVHEPLHDAVVVFRPEIDELAKRLLVEISAASG